MRNERSNIGGYQSEYSKMGGDAINFLLYECNRSPIRQEIIALLRSKGGIANNYDENGNFIEPEDEDDY